MGNGATESREAPLILPNKRRFRLLDPCAVSKWCCRTPSHLSYRMRPTGRPLFLFASHCLMQQGWRLPPGACGEPRGGRCEQPTRMQCDLPSREKRHRIYGKLGDKRKGVLSLRHTVIVLILAHPPFRHAPSPPLPSSRQHPKQRGGPSHRPKRKPRRLHPQAPGCDCSPLAESLEDRRRAGAALRVTVTPA